MITRVSGLRDRQLNSLYRAGVVKTYGRTCADFEGGPAAALAAVEAFMASEVKANGGNGYAYDGILPVHRKLANAVRIKPFHERWVTKTEVITRYVTVNPTREIP